MKNIILICLALGAAMPAAAQEWEDLSDSGKAGRLIGFAELCKRAKLMTYGDGKTDWVEVIKESAAEDSDFQKHYEITKRQMHRYDTMSFSGNTMCHEFKPVLKEIAEEIIKREGDKNAGDGS